MISGPCQTAIELAVMSRQSRYQHGSVRTTAILHKLLLYGVYRCGLYAAMQLKQLSKLA